MAIYPVKVNQMNSLKLCIYVFDTIFCQHPCRREKAANARIVGVEGKGDVIKLARYYKCSICKSTTKSKVKLLLS